MPMPSILEEAPAFKAGALLPNKEFGVISLSDYRGKWVVFFWYPLDFTFVCPTEIIAFGDRYAEFEDINANVVAASCDSLYSHLAWVNMPRAEGGLGFMNIPIVADFDKKVASSYGVLLPDGVPVRALFIIDPKGLVRQITVNDLSVGRNVDEIIRLIKAHQFVEKYGDVCPANWQPGDVAVSVDPVKSKDYFRAEVHGIRDSFTPLTIPPLSPPAAFPPLLSVDDVTDRAVFAALVASPQLTVVDYWAPWCKNCKKISPTISKLASEFPNVKFIKINTIEAEDISVDNGVDALPTIQFFRGKIMVGEFKGSDVTAVDKVVRSYVSKASA